MEDLSFRDREKMKYSKCLKSSSISTLSTLIVLFRIELGLFGLSGHHLPPKLYPNSKSTNQKLYLMDSLTSNSAHYC